MKIKFLPKIPFKDFVFDYLDLQNAVELIDIKWKGEFNVWNLWFLS
jgi:hypothetical protein